ncbi:MAG: hypothetical protein JXA13_10130 [Anaerolineales bacterium]|nr:hypothetical protein [Anaerolineales bacterium]
MLYKHRNSFFTHSETRWTLILIGVLLASILIRLAFLSALLMPPYFDSPRHYQLIHMMVDIFEDHSSLSGFWLILKKYYHIGYHFTLAGLVTWFEMDAARLMLVWGQIVLACLPLPLYYVIRRQTCNNAAALVTVFLMGWAWAMPAHAVNWGKYPALSALLAFQFGLGVLSFKTPNRIFRWALAASGLLLSVAFHTRILFFIVATLIGFFAGRYWVRISPQWRRICLLLVTACLVGLLSIVSGNKTLNLVFEPYLGSYLPMTLLAVSLLSFSYYKYPQFTFSVLLTVLQLFVLLFIPVPQQLGAYGGQTLLDRLIVEMSLGIPLAFFGGLGFSVIADYFHTEHQFSRNAIRVAGALAVVWMSYVFIRHDSHPSDCCQYVKQDDLLAITWLDKSLFDDIRIAISSRQMDVFMHPSPDSIVATDAGSWITPLTSRQSVLFPFTADFGLEITLTELCERGIEYVYVSSMEESFRKATLDQHPDWYRLVFYTPGASIYQLDGCYLQKVPIQ